MSWARYNCSSLSFHMASHIGPNRRWGVSIPGDFRFVSPAPLASLFLLWAALPFEAVGLPTGDLARPLWDFAATFLPSAVFLLSGFLVPWSFFKTPFLPSDSFCLSEDFLFSALFFDSRALSPFVWFLATLLGAGAVFAVSVLAVS